MAKHSSTEGCDRIGDNNCLYTRVNKCHFAYCLKGLRQYYLFQALTVRKHISRQFFYALGYFDAC